MRYVDSSALAKRYVTEADGDVVRGLEPEGLTTSRLSEVGVASALSRRKREGVCTTGDHDLALEALISDLSRIPVIEVASRVTSRARDLVRRHPLRAADAIHLASCLLLQATTRGPVELVAFDRKLRDAAKLEGLAVLPPDTAR